MPLPRVIRLAIKQSNLEPKTFEADANAVLEAMILEYGVAGAEKAASKHFKSGCYGSVAQHLWHAAKIREQRRAQAR